jgi:hypothetical protein
MKTDTARNTRNMQLFEMQKESYFLTQITRFQGFLTVIQYQHVWHESINIQSYKGFKIKIVTYLLILSH